MFSESSSRNDQLCRAWLGACVLTVLCAVAPAFGQSSGGGQPDPTLLPVATTAQVPLTAAYNGLNVPAKAAGGTYLDPTTGVKIYKLTSATFPTASPNWGHDYAEGGDEVSLPYNGTTRAVLVRHNDGGWWLVDFTPGVGVSNPRPLTGSLSPFMDIAFTFSNNPATPYYAYVSNGSQIIRFDFRTMTVAPGNGWPVSESQAAWLHQSENDGFFVWMRGSNGTTAVGYAPATGTLKTYTNANLNEPRIDRAGRYVGLAINVPFGSLYVWDWQTNSISWTTPGDPGIPFAHNAGLRRRWITADWNMNYPPDFTMFIPDVPNSAQHIGGPANATLIYCNGNWVQYPANLNDQWALCSNYGSLRPPESYWLAPGGMILMTPNGQRRLLGHPYNTTGNYTFYSFAKFSPDGKYVLFTSNMNGASRSDVFLAEVPAVAEGPDTLPPTVTLTAPASGAAVSGSAVTLSATASDNVGVAGVQFKRDGINLGAEDTAAPFAIAWNTTLGTAGAHSLTAVARDAAGQTATAAAVSVTVDNTLPLISTVSAFNISLSGATITWATNEASNSQVDYGLTTAYGSATPVNASLLTAHAMTPTGLVANTLYHYRVKSRDAAGNLAVSGDLTFTTLAPGPDTTPPSVSMTAPTAGAIVAGTATVSASATDNVGVVGVQFKLDGANLGAERTAAPYAVTWTITASKGTHTLTAVARDTAGNTKTSTAVSVTVANGTGLVGYWALDEGTGTTATDSSGNGNNGTLVNGPTWTIGKLGSALAFNGLTHYVNVPSTPVLNAYPLTVAVWMQTASTAGVRGIVNKYVANSYNGYQVFLSNGNLCAWYIRDTANYVYDGSGCTFNLPGYNDNLWHHVAYVVNASGSNLYVDGVQKGSLGWTGTAGPQTTIQPIHLGHYPGANGGAEYFPGALDDVRIYNRALSTADILILYNAGTGSTADTTSPTVGITTPAAGATITGTVTVSANATDNIGVVGVQFKLDGVNLGAEDTVAPYAVSWTATVPTNGTHSLTAVARDAAGNSTTSAGVSVTVTNPTLTILAPLNGATLANLTKVKVQAASGIGLSVIQLYSDSSLIATVKCATNPCSETTNTVMWHTNGLAAGPHSLYVVSTDTFGNSRSSVPITVFK
jgi:hypothetical protein